MLIKIEKNVYINSSQLTEVHIMENEDVHIFTAAGNDEWIKLSGEDAKEFLAYLDFLAVDLSQWRKSQLSE